ncbi:hypothetical protein TKK_0003816 [Trichogramma kaykai]
MANQTQRRISPQHITYDTSDGLDFEQERTLPSMPVSPDHSNFKQETLFAPLAIVVDVEEDADSLAESFFFVFRNKCESILVVNQDKKSRAPLHLCIMPSLLHHVANVILRSIDNSFSFSGSQRIIYHNYKSYYKNEGLEKIDYQLDRWNALAIMKFFVRPVELDRR